MTTFTSQVEAGGTVTLPSGTTVWDSAINITAPVSVLGQSDGSSTVQLPANPQANFIAADGTPLGPPGTTHTISNNLCRTTGAVADIVWQNVTFDLNIQQYSDAFGGSVFWHRGGNAQALCPTYENITFKNGWGGQPNGGPNGIQINSSGILIKNFTWTSNAVAPTQVGAFGLPDALVFGGGPGFVLDTVDIDGYIEFDQAPCTGLSIKDLTVNKILIGDLTGTDWEGAVINVTLNNTTYNALTVDTACTGLTIKTQNGSIVFNQ